MLLKNEISIEVLKHFKTVCYLTFTPFCLKRQVISARFIDRMDVTRDNRYVEILRKIYYFLLDTIQTILITASVFMILYAFVIQPNQVSGSSMYPTFQDKEYLLSYLLDVRFDKYQRGDVVVFRSPVELEKLYIKRVIALPGDHVMVSDGKVLLNGEELDESVYLSPDVYTNPGSFLQDGIEKIVPSGAIVVMGDNRQYSSDSREWGFLAKDRVVGRSIMRFFPFDKAHVIRNPFSEHKI